MSVLTQTLRDRLSRFIGNKVVTDADLGSRLIVASGQYTTVGGAAAEAVTLTGVKDLDRVVATLTDDGPNNVSLKYGDVTAANTMTLTFSADPGAGTKVNYLVFANN
jgi:hypothetical protein